MPLITLYHYGRSQPILAVSMIHHNLQQVGINPEYEKVLSETYPSKTRNKVTPRSMQGRYQWG
jgi:hypothetical protein